MKYFFIAFIVILFSSSCSKNESRMVMSYKDFQMTREYFTNSIEKWAKKDSKLISMEVKKKYLESVVFRSWVKSYIASSDSNFTYNYSKYKNLELEKRKHKKLYQKLVDDYVLSDAYLKIILPLYNKKISFSQIVLKKEQSELADSLLAYLRINKNYWNAVAESYSEEYKKGKSGEHSIFWGRVSYPLQKYLFLAKNIGIQPKVLSTRKGLHILRIDKIESVKRTSAQTVNEFRRYLQEKDKRFFQIESRNYGKYIISEEKRKYPLAYMIANMDSFLLEFKQLENKAISEIKFPNRLLARSMLGEITTDSILEKLKIDRYFFAKKMGFFRRIHLKEALVDKFYVRQILNKLCIKNGVKASIDDRRNVGTDLKFLIIQDYIEYLSEGITTSEDELIKEYEAQKKKKHLASYGTMKRLIKEDLLRKKAITFLEKKVDKIYKEEFKKLKIFYDNIL